MKIFWPAVIFLLAGGSAGCGGCTTDVRPGIILYIQADQPGANDICNTQVLAYTDDGYVDFAEHYRHTSDGETPGCNLQMAFEQPGNFTIEVRTQGFEALVIEDVILSADRCHVRTAYLSETLTTASANCHDGYEWVDDACQTPNGCTFPELERAVYPGTQEAPITYECAMACETEEGWFRELPEAPGRCPALALP